MNDPVGVVSLSQGLEEPLGSSENEGTPSSHVYRYGIGCHPRRSSTWTQPRWGWRSHLFASPGVLRTPVWMTQPPSGLEAWRDLCHDRGALHHPPTVIGLSPERRSCGKRMNDPVGVVSLSQGLEESLGSSENKGTPSSHVYRYGIGCHPRRSSTRTQPRWGW